MPFPEVIDNTIRKAIAQCHTQAMYRHIMNIRPRGEPSVDLHFGGCYAHGMEVIRKNFWEREIPYSGCPDDAIAMGIEAAVKMWGDFRLPADSKSNKTLDRLVAAFHFYFTVWPLGEDGLTPLPGGIECMFDYELPILHPDTGKNLRYAGRYDMRAKDKQSRIYIVDEKTTSRLGDSWISQWDLDTQMTGYIWAERCRIDDLNPGVDVEVMAQIRGISILKNDFGHCEIPIVRPQWMIDRWYFQLLTDITKWKEAYLDGTFDLALHSNACSAYSRDCDYKPLCLSPNPERLIPGAYHTVVWNPLERKA